MWANTFDARLLEWRDLREQAKNLDLKEALIAIDKWWQQAPLTSHYLHMDEYENWPDPWDLLADNTFCDLAKCLGIVYTIVLLSRDDLEKITIIETPDFFVVEINNEHILNYYPNEIVNKKDLELKIVRSLDSHYLNIN